MDIKDTTNNLRVLLDKYDWFYDAAVEKNSITVYVNHITAEILSLIPITADGFQVKVAFSGYLLCYEKYGRPIGKSFNKSSLEGYFEEVD